MTVLFEKLKEVSLSVLPITLIVLALHFTIVPLEPNLLLRFLIGAVMIVVGLTFFLLGTDIGITPIGTLLGKGLAKRKKIGLLIPAGLILGFLISIAEPDLQILANQVATVTNNQLSRPLILVSVSTGIALMLTIGLLRVVFDLSLNLLLTALYTMVLVLSLFVGKDFLAIAFDASGATTGALTVPFILALSVGISTLKRRHQDAESNTFGLVSIASSGAIIAVMVMSIISKQETLTGSLPVEEFTAPTIMSPFWTVLGPTTRETIIALLPIVIIFLLYHAFGLHLTFSKLRKILVGTFYVLIGLILFLVGVHGAFLEVGSTIGHQIGSLGKPAYSLLIAFILGLVTILAEPAVSVLTHQIETATNGYIKRWIILVALSLGVGSAVCLSVLRSLIPGLQLWHFLLPGYLISIALMSVVPKMFVGMAFDAGGVASGPMTATFILTFVQGIAEAVDGADVLRDGFGMIALVAMMPIITIQIVGLIYKLTSRKEGHLDDNRSNQAL